ncbi:hypothetical protein C27AD_12246 [Salinisphaera hydrothermalis C27AD]
MPKGAEAVSGFRSWPAFLYACLLEGDRDVVSFRSTDLVALHYKYGAGKHTLSPDLLVTEIHRRVVVVISGNEDGTLHPAAEEALTNWCDAHSFVFRCISSTAIEGRWVEALNWFRITRWLPDATNNMRKDLDHLEHLVRTLNGPTIGVMSRHLSTLPRDTLQAFVAELLHNHVVSADLASMPITWGTRLFPA